MPGKRSNQKQQAFTEKDRQRLFAGIKEIAEKCRFMASKKDKVLKQVDKKKKSRRGHNGDDKRDGDRRSREKIVSIKNLPTLSYISSCRH
jgi:hypothetical protein